MQSSPVVLLLALFGFFIPAQTRHTSHMAFETHQDACTGLSSGECCAQMLEIAVFRATGDQVPKAAKTPVRLSCAAPSSVVPEGACRSIAMARGFAVKDVSGLCAVDKIGKRCEDNAGCKSCARELVKLGFQNAERACLAATYVPASADGGDTVIVLHDGKSDASGSGIEVRKRRTVVQK